MTESSATRNRMHAARVKALRAMADWMEPYSTLPVSEYVADIVRVTDPVVLENVAIAHGLDGPYTAGDGSRYLYQAFGGGVTWQAVHYPDNTGMSEAERHARAWAAHNGLVLVPRTNTVHTHDATGGTPCR